LTHPELHPKGKATQAYGLSNEELGAGNRGVIIVDKERIIRFRETYGPGVLPDPEDIFAAIDQLA
jgi:alkyl hydroperoxide reductase subunit AhpC